MVPPGECCRHSASTFLSSPPPPGHDTVFHGGVGVVQPYHIPSLALQVWGVLYPLFSPFFIEELDPPRGGYSRPRHAFVIS